MAFTKKSLCAALCIVAAMAFSLSAQQYFNNWKITPDACGNKISMVMSHPSTPLGAELEVSYEIDNAGIPQKARVKFQNGRERAMTPEEMGFYFSFLRGLNAYWDYMMPQGKLNSFTSSIDMIPLSFLGRPVRVIANDGSNYIGTLSQNTNTPDWISLDIKGNRILFWRKAVREIQSSK